MHKSCDNCKYDNKGLYEAPCFNCKNNKTPGSSEYESAPFLWEPQTNDAIKPDYYNDTKIAPIDVIEDWDLDFCLGSALKYIKRAGKKDNNPSVQDLRKVIWYVERRIKELEEASE